MHRSIIQNQCHKKYPFGRDHDKAFIRVGSAAWNETNDDDPVRVAVKDRIVTGLAYFCMYKIAFC